MKRLLTKNFCKKLVALLPIFCAVGSLAAQATAVGSFAVQATSDDAEFFEREIRPILVNHCYQCHSAQAEMVSKGLRLDSRAGMLKGGESGPAILPGNPHESRLIQRIHGKPVLMPPTGSLGDEQIASLVRWVEMGAPWTDQTSIARENQGFNLEERRAAHWAWQPVRLVSAPKVDNEDWPIRTLDRFVLSKLEDARLKPAPPADRHALIRRLSFDLRGLPPSPWEIKTFVDDPSPAAYEKLVDRFLDSPHFGERWARHWMDLFRYSESHGSEGDPDIPMAWRYRDYLIRAFNADVPYNQLIREHLAGDLLANPRINKRDGINESLLATAHFRMVEHGFQPLDPLEDRVKWTDNQIDVVSKAFQGLTVSCARCHDHKFDAISQKDYYALFGTLYGARPTQRAIDDPEMLETNRQKLVQLKEGVRRKLAQAWLLKAESIDSKFSSESRDDGLQDSGKESALDWWAELSAKQGSGFRKAWQKLRDHWQSEIARRETFNQEHFNKTWDLSSTDLDTIGHGTGFTEEPSRPGEFWISSIGDRILNGIYPAGVYTHLLSSKHNAVIQTPRFKIETDHISLRLLGEDLSFAQLIIENYAVPRNGVYSMRYSPKKDQMDWLQWDTTFWKGFTGYIEFATREDVTTFTYDPIDLESELRPQPRRDGRSYIGASRIVFHDAKETPEETVVPILYLLEGAFPNSPQQLAQLVRRRLMDAIKAWGDGNLSEKQAVFLDEFVRRDLLPRSLDDLESLGPLVNEYRVLEEEVPVARRAPGVLEEGSPAQPFLVRGNHKNPGQPVPRQFLTALRSAPYGDPAAVRLRLAEEIVSPDNPLTARVMINRIWKHLFGRGIVSTVDNFGKLGEAPTHPELLDYLAGRFVEEGFSIKGSIRRLATSRAYRASSQASTRAKELDPTNRLLQHANLRRLDAEAIRDSVLLVSGRLDPSQFGPSVRVYYAYSTGKTKGDKEKGPLDGEGRRSIYQEIRRNAHNPFLEVFDLPKPASARGQRDATNVPAQSLTLLNSPFVINQAALWARRLVEGEAYSIDSRIEHMFLKALGRLPLPDELERAGAYMSGLATEHGVSQVLVLSAAAVWQDFAHGMFNLKEFIYIR